MHRSPTWKKHSRLGCVCCAIVLGLWLLAACDSAEDLAKDVAKDVIDYDFEEDVTIPLRDVTTTKTVAVSTQADDDCVRISVEAALQEIEDKIEDLDLVDIESVTFNWGDASYRNASWSPATETLTCKLTISGKQSTEIAEADINAAQGTIPLNLTDEQIGVINYYLANRTEPFTYCVTCDNPDDFDAYSVTYSVDINVLIKGNI